MKTLATYVVASAALIATPAFAATPKKKIIPPPPPPARVYSWTGWYVGGNVGYGWGDAKTDLTANGNVVSSAVCISSTGCPPFFNIPVPSSFAFAASNTA